MVRALFSALVLFASAARAYDFKKDSTGAAVKWQRPLALVADKRLEVQLGAQGSRTALVESVRAVAGAAPGLALTMTDGEGGKVGFDFNAAEKNRSDVVALDDWGTYDEDAVAITVVTVDTRTHAIIDSDIAFDASRKWSVIGEKHEYRYDVQNTFTHELGHAVGLAHSQESEAVMYGKTTPGETKKRQLAADDSAALSQLYPASAGSPGGTEVDEPAQGCSSTGQGPAGGPVGLLLFGLFVLARSKAAQGVALALAMTLPFAASAQESIAKADQAVKVAMVGTVKRATTLPPEEGVTVLKTVLEIEVSMCLTSGCPSTVRLYVPGGRWGNYEQRVGGMDVPKEGDTVGLSRGAGKDPWVRLEPLKTTSARDAFFEKQAVKLAQK
jgi:hypothetical protein